MAPRPLTTLAVLALLCASACTKTTGRASDPPTLVAPATIADLDDYADARNAYALLDVGDPERVRVRAKLRGYLLGYLDRALESDRGIAAVDALEQLAGLWLATELPSLAPDPELADAAERVYNAYAASGDERPALLALGIMQAFGDAVRRARAEQGYALITDWLERTTIYADDPRVFVQLDVLLEDVSAHLPSPFLVTRLADLYLERYRGAQASAGLSGVTDPRVPFTGYLLARLYLRADDLPAAIDALRHVDSGEPTGDLLTLLEDAHDSAHPLDYLDALIDEFTPEPDNRLPPELVLQGWGIVDNLARRSLALAPDHAPAHLARGRVLRARNHIDAALIHYERAFAGKTWVTKRDDLHRAWSELAELYQLALESRADSDSPATDSMLERVEAFHLRAAEVWPQQPIEPSVTLAWMTVAVAAFNAGDIERAETLMAKTIALDSQPAALSLLGTIAMRRGEFDDARTQFTRLDRLADRLPDQLDRYDWQIRSRIGRAETEALAGDASASVTELREALRQLNTLLSYPGLSQSMRAEFVLRRARVFFLLGEINLGMDDAREAQTLAPGHADAYSDPLIFTVTHGHLEQAASLLDAALAQDVGELGVYYSLWVLDLAARVHAPAPERARDYLQRFASDDESSDWLRKLARYGLGQLDYEHLVAAATSRRERSEAYFYEALASWRGGSHEASLELMRDVLDQQMMADFEYRMAQSYLRWNELPKTARAAMVSVGD